jgi:LPS sulfotransferase NodH
LRRFVFVCGARSGSTLLWTAIGQHPRVAMSGEVFGNSDEERRAHPINDRWCSGNEDGASYLRDVIFAQSGVDAIGFKLFYDHAPAESPLHSVWQAITDDKDVAVLHLVRANRLARLVSIEVGQRTQRWLVWAEDERPATLPPFSLDVVETRRRLDAMAHNERAATARFAGHAYLELGYERDLVRDFAGSVARVFAWLGVPPVAVRARVQKQATLSLAEQISNYDELRAALTGTEHEKYFQPI